MLEELLNRPAWQERATCRGQGHDGFIIESRRAPSAAGLAMCGRCLVREDCLAFAIEHEDVTGIWGGTTERERREIRRRAA
jgi:WhiB family redox-sensing transcriptional regulator